MLKSVIAGLGLINALLVAVMLQEIRGLPGLSATLSVLCNHRLSLIESLSILTFFVAIAPLFSVVFILSHFKKYIFNHAKSITDSYKLIVQLYLIALGISMFWILIDFLMTLTLANGKLSYLHMRRFSMQPGSYLHYMVPAAWVCSLVLQVAGFVALCLLAEMVIAYKQFNSQQTFREFCARNSYFIVYMAFIVGMLLLVYALFEYNFYAYSRERYTMGSSIGHKLLYSSLPSVGMLYIYYIVSLN